MSELWIVNLILFYFYFYFIILDLDKKDIEKGSRIDDII